MGNTTTFESEELGIIAEQSFGMVLLADLMEPPEGYQRAYSKGKEKEIIREFDIRVAREIVVSRRRNGWLVIVDGRHTVAALKEKGYTEHRAQILDDLTIGEEAKLFRYFNTRRANPKAIELFNARRIEGQPSAVAIEEIANKYGFEITKSSGARKICAVAALDAIYRSGGDYLLKKVLHFVSITWPDEPRNGEAAVLRGTAIFFSKLAGDWPSSQTLAEKLSNVDLPAILRRAQAIAELNIGKGTGIHGAVAHAILDEYNKSKRTKQLAFK